MKRALVILLGALLLALALGAVTVVLLATTEGGTRFLAGQAERFLPVRFTDVSGALLRQIRVGRVELELGDRTLTIDDLAVAMQVMPLLFDNRLTIDAVSAAAVVLSGSEAPPEPGPPPPLELPFLPLEIDVAQATVERLVIDQVFPLRVSASAAWLRRGLEVRSLEVSSEVVDGVLEGRLGTGSNPTLSASASWSLPGTDWGGQGTLEGRVGSFQLQHTLRGLVAGQARGTGSLADLSEPQVDVQVDLDDLIFGDTAIRGISGRLSGTLANLSADLDGGVQVPDLEPVAVAVQAYGPVSGPLTVRSATAEALAGVLEAQGSVAWSDGVRVRLGGSVDGIDLQRLAGQLTGTVGGLFQFAYEQDRVSLALSELDGTLDGRPVGGSLQLAQVGAGWAVDPLRITVGDNQIAGSASIDGPRVSLRADIDAPGLEGLALGVSGDARGRVDLSGTWPDLNGSASLTSTQLRGFAAELHDVTLDASMNDGVLDGSVRAARAARQQLELADARLTASGPLESLSWRAAWSAGAGSGAFERRDDGFVLRLADARMEALEQTWALQAPTRLLLLDDRIELAPACVAGGDAAACIETFVYADGRIETRGELTRAPVALLQAWLPVRLAGDGFAEGRWSLAGTPDDLRGDLSLAARRLAVVPASDEDAISLPDLEASGTVGDGVLQMQVAATDEAFTLTGEGRLAPLDVNGALSGTLRIAAADLSPLNAFDQRVESLAGSVEGQLDLSGTPAAPRVEGRLRVQDGVLKLNDPDIRLSAIDVRVRLDDNGTFDVQGSAKQKQQEVRLAASGSGLFANALAVDATLKGDGLRAKHPDWGITVSPDLSFAYADGKGRLRGTVTVPQAEVRLSTLPSSVPSASEDVVVVGRESNGNGGSSRIRVDVDVVLGDDVALKALGITAELEGSLRARLDAQGTTTLRGTLNVTGGVLSAQGQTLSIESGTVVYNGPVTRPYIDLRAVRVIEDVSPTVKVGLHIRGDADNLTSSVFSEPAMSDTRALSFLVLGRDIDQETADSDGNQLMAAAINLGLSRSKGITSELMRMTGLDELSAMAESQDSFAIVAGKRIGSDLYVRYTYNTLSAVGAFLVRYDLTKRWQLEAQSGEQSAMDLMYSFDK